MEFSNPSYGPAISEIFVLGMLVVSILGELFVKRVKHFAYYGVLSALIGAAVLTFAPASNESVVIFNGLFVSNVTTSILKSFIYLCVFVTLIYSRHYVEERDIPGPEYYILALFSTLGMMVLVSANSLLTIYLGLELLSLPLYAMVSLNRSNTENTEAALKYFVMGAIASGMLLYGMSMIYGATGSLTITHIAAAVAAADKGVLLTIGLVFLVVGVGFKLAAVPFHMWAPDVYTGAPLSVTLFLSTAPKLAAYGMAVRILLDALPSLYIQWHAILIILAVLSMGIGNLFAIAQDNIKRLLAYSAISQIGYMMLGLIAGTPDGYAASLFYILVYALTTLASFGLLLLLAKDGFEPECIADLSGLNTRSPWLAFLMLLIMLSLAGIPPLVGFFAKFWVLKALIHTGAIGLATLAIIFAIIGLFYYIRVIKVMYFDPPHETQPLAVAADCRLVMSLNALSLLGLGIFPLSLFQLCLQAFR